MGLMPNYKGHHKRQVPAQQGGNVAIKSGILSYTATVNSQAVFSRPELVCRKEVAELLPSQYKNVYLYMMGLYDTVNGDIWPELPQDNEEFIQLCCFLQVLEAMAMTELVVRDMRVQFKISESTNQELGRQVRELSEQNISLREKLRMQQKIERDTLNWEIDQYNRQDVKYMNFIDPPQSIPPQLNPQVLSMSDLLKVVDSFMGMPSSAPFNPEMIKQIQDVLNKQNKKKPGKKP
jgi:hypothetical protein